MSTEHDDRRGVPSPIDRVPNLREIADPELVTELCDSLGRLTGVGVALYDLEGRALVPPPPVPAYCEARATKWGEGARCGSTKDNCALPLEPDQTTAVRGCYTGFKYLAISIRVNLEPVGVAVVGPFAEEATAGQSDPPEGASAEQRFELAILQERVRRVDEAERARIGSFVGTTLELFLFAFLKTYLASKVHMESVHESFRELQAKNRELSASYEKLKALDVMKSNFLATVSHELRTPLTSIIGYGEMVLEGIGGKIPVGAKKNVELIVNKGEQLLELINSVLDMSKIESGRMELNVDRVKIAEVVKDAVGSVTPQAKKKSLKLVAKVDDDVPELVADKYKLRIILVNLLSNAVKFTPEKGKVSVTSKRLGGKGPDARVRVEVTDSGIGIPPDQLGKVFERFYQVDNSSTRQYGGTGLGLPIVRSFVEMHGGTIDVSSEVGEGTTFTVTLPLAPPRRT